MQKIWVKIKEIKNCFYGCRICLLEWDKIQRNAFSRYSSELVLFTWHSKKHCLKVHWLKMKDFTLQDVWKPLLPLSSTDKNKYRHYYGVLGYCTAVWAETMNYNCKVCTYLDRPEWWLTTHWITPKQSVQLIRFRGLAMVHH